MIAAFFNSQNIFRQIQSNSKEESSLAENNFSILKIRQIAEIAEQELKHGFEALSLADNSSGKDFQIIAEWHFRRCLEKSQSAKLQFSEAGKVQKSTKREKYCRIKADRMTEIISQTIRILDMFSNTKSGFKE